MDDKNQVKKIYLIGIKGMAMSGLAVMARQLGYEVNGSDSEYTYSTEAIDRQFRNLGITAYDGFDPEHLINFKPDRVIISAAYGPDHLEIKAAKSLRCTIMTQSEMLGEIVSKFEVVGVAGVHGKTTITALLAFILEEAGYSPSYAVGAPEVVNLKGNGHIGDGKYFIVEADEYRKSEDDKTPKFFDLPLKHVIITSIELDHPDLYESAEEVYEVFYKLSTRIPRDGTIVACSDWPLVKRLANRFVDRVCLTYGFELGAHFQVVDLKEGDRIGFALKTNDKVLGPFTMQLPGRYNALNGAAAIIMALKLGVSEAVLSKALPKFSGAARRFQSLGQVNGATIIDDYAHHPTAVAGVIDAARKRFPTKKIIAVFQPHTYSRTGRFLKEFAQSLVGADKVILLNIFASAREKSGYVSIKDLIDATRELRPDVEYRATTEEVGQYLKSFITSNDVVLLIGAGDVNKIFTNLQSA